MNEKSTCLLRNINKPVEAPFLSPTFATTVMHNIMHLLVMHNLPFITEKYIYITLGMRFFLGI
jgi:hypothetical protein